MNLARYSKAIAVAIPSAISFLNLVLPVTSGTTKLYVSAALAVLSLLAVYFAPENARPAPVPTTGTANPSPGPFNPTPPPAH